MRCVFSRISRIPLINLEEAPRFFHTSEISFTLAGNKSVSQKEFLNHGLKPEEFQRMLWECKIGGPDIREDKKKDVLYLYSLLTNRLIIWLHVEERHIGNAFHM